MTRYYILLGAALILFVASIVTSFDRAEDRDVIRKAQEFMKVGPRSTAQHDRILCDHMNYIALHVGAIELDCTTMYELGLQNKHPLGDD